MISISNPRVALSTALALLALIAPVNAGGRLEYDCCAVSRSGRYVAGGLRDGTVELDDTERRTSRLLEPRSRSSFFSLCFAPDESMLVAADHFGEVVRWELDEPRESLEWPTNVIREGEFPEDLEGSTRAEIRREVSWYHAPRITISPDATRILLAWEDGRRELLTRDGALVAEYRDARRRPASSADGWGDLGGWFDARDAVWHPTTGAMLLRLGDEVRGFDPATGAPIHRGWDPVLFAMDGEAHSCAVSPDGERVAIGYGNMHVGLFDYESGERLLSYRYTDSFFLSESAMVHQLAFSPSGDRLAFTSAGGAYVGVLDARTFEELYDSDFRGGHFGEVLRLSWLPGGEGIAYWFDCGSGGLRVLDLRTEPRERDYGVLLRPSFSDDGVVAVDSQTYLLARRSYERLLGPKREEGAEERVEHGPAEEDR